MNCVALGAAILTDGYEVNKGTVMLGETVDEGEVKLSVIVRSMYREVPRYLEIGMEEGGILKVRSVHLQLTLRVTVDGMMRYVGNVTRDTEYR